MSLLVPFFNISSLLFLANHLGYQSSINLGLHTEEYNSSQYDIYKPERGLLCYSKVYDKRTIKYKDEGENSI